MTNLQELTEKEKARFLPLKQDFIRNLDLISLRSDLLLILHAAMLENNVVFQTNLAIKKLDAILNKEMEVSNA